MAAFVLLGTSILSAEDKKTEANGGQAAAEHAASDENGTFKTTDLFFSAAGEVWTTPEFGGQGIGILGVQFSGLPRGSSLRVLLNTETLQIDYGNLRFNFFEIGFRLKGELFYAGLLPNYFLEGTKIPEYGFNASYLEGETHFVFRFSDIANLALSLQGKQWFFGTNSATAVSFRLPENKFVFTPRLIFTYWALEGDPSVLMPHYYYPRIKGAGFSVYAGTDILSNAEQWGPVNGSGDFINGRNDPEQVSFFVRQWLRWGVPLGSRIRLQITEQAGYGYGQDDLGRRRIGGMNPYVVPVHGLPWAAVLSETYAAGEISFHLRLFGKTEFILIADVAGIQDLERTGTGTWGAVIGTAAGLDMRFGKWFVNARFGYSFVPAYWDNRHFTGLFIGLGRSFHIP